MIDFLTKQKRNTGLLTDSFLRSVAIYMHEVEDQSHGKN